MTAAAPPLATLIARRVDRQRCPFAEAEVRIDLREGACVHLRGPTGAGKSTLTGCLAGLTPRHRLRQLGIDVRVQWREDVPPRERVGALFQSTTLIDSLSVRGNVAAALELSGRARGELEADVKRLVEAVGLDYARDGRKMPGELSGGMARRASLALQLAQAKRAIILDEPFTGLDRAASAAVARELVEMRRAHGTALLLVSHQPDVVALVHDPKTDDAVDLTPAHPEDAAGVSAHGTRGGLHAHHFVPRLRAKTSDFLFCSAPLIALTFSAAGIAVASLLADLLLRVDVRAAVERVLDGEVAPLVKALLGADAPPLQLALTMGMVKTKARGLVDGALPGARAALYAHGVAKLFTLELGPLLTGLLLAGRIGGSYAGEVGTMEASAQSKLLAVLGASARRWTLLPAALAALVAAPLLSAMGTALALALAALVGEWYHLEPPGSASAAAAAGAALAAGGTTAAAADGHVAILARAFNPDSWFWTHVRDALAPELRLRCLSFASGPSACARARISSDLLELLSWPLAHHVLKSASFIALTLACAEVIARRDADLPPRAVPHVITASVVSAGVAIILADWAWSRVLLAREGSLF